jgi:Tfp pilus assembly protein PilP
LHANDLCLYRKPAGKTEKEGEEEVMLNNSLIEAKSASCYRNATSGFALWLYTPLMRVLMLIFLILLSGIPVDALEKKQEVAKKVEKAATVVEAPIHYVGVLYKSGNRRDPFLAPPKPQPPAKDEELPRGTPPPGIAGTFIAQTGLEGISIRNDKRIAIVRGKDDRAYFLHAGDKLFDGYLKSIQEDSIVLVRVTNMKSGKTMTQEVTKRLRTP